MPRNENIENEIKAHSRRLQLLKERYAKQGYNTPPEVITEIEDIEKKLEELQSKSPKVAPPLHTRFIIGGIILVLIFIFGLAIINFIPIPPPPTPTSAPPPASTLPLPPPNKDEIAVMGAVNGRINVIRSEENPPIVASSGLDLFDNDVISSHPGSSATIYCFRENLLFSLLSSRTVQLTCQAPPPPVEGLELLDLLSPEVNALIKDEAQTTSPSSEEIDRVRGLRDRSLDIFGNEPTLLSPRQVTAQLQPIFRWTTVQNAEAYTLKIEGQDIQHSLDTTNAIRSQVKPLVLTTDIDVLEVEYPADAPPLTSGVSYFVTLQAHLPNIQTPQESSETPFFEVLDQSTINEINEIADQIQSSAIPEDEKAYQRSLLFRQHNLWAEAAYEMERLAWSNPESPPLLELGDLYLRAGLIDLAQANYQRALESSQVNEDIYTQAAALVGLGNAAYADQANDEAKGRYNQALDLYRQLGDARQVEAVENQLSAVN